MAVIGTLSVKLGLITVEWDQATAKAKAQAKDLQKEFNNLSGNIQTLYGHWKTLGGAMSLSAVGMAALLTDTMRFSDEISDLAKGFDISVAKTLQFKEAIKGAGGNAEGASKILSTLFTKIQDARSGNEAAISQFEQIGISFEELAAMKPEQALNRVFDALSKIGSTYERVKAVKDLLGKQGIGLEVEAVSEKLGMSTAKYAQYAKSIEKVAQVNDDLAASFDNMKIAFADMIAPFTREGVVGPEKFKAAMVALTSAAVISGLIQVVSLSAKLIEVWKSGAKVQAALTAMGGMKGMIQLGAAAAAYYASLKYFELDSEEGGTSASGPLIRADGSSAQGASDKEALSRRELIAAAAKTELLRRQIDFAKEDGQIKLDALSSDKFSIQLRENQLTLDKEIATAVNQRAQSLNKENLSAAQRAAIETDYKKAIELADAKANANAAVIVATREKELALIERQAKFALMLEGFDERRMDLEQQRVYMTDYEYKTATERLNTERKVAELQQQILDAKERLGKGKTFDAEEKRLNGAIEIEQRLSEIRQKGIDAEEQRRTSFSEGWAEAFKKFEQDAQNYGKLGADVFGSFVGNMNSAIDSFVKTGKVNFKSLAQSIIQDTMAMILKFQAMQLVMMGMRAMGWSGGFGGMGGMFGGAGGGQTLGVGGFGDLPGFGGASFATAATGGEIDGPTLVGENGPEIFVPQRRGTVIPNMQASSMGMSQPQVVYNGPYIANMSAIDTQSGIQFLSKNKQTIWAANQSAQRSLPASR
jgi:lambda family phage tail tape measure protein